MAKRLTEKQKVKIRADYVNCGNLREVARAHGVSDRTVKRVVNEDAAMTQKVADKKEELELDILSEMQKRSNNVLAIYDKGITRIFNLIDDTKDVARLATAMGILIDKQVMHRDYKGKLQELEFKARELGMKESSHAAMYAMDEVANQYRGLPAASIAKSYIDIDRDINARKHSQYDLKGGRGGGRSSYCSLKLVDQIMLNPALCGLVVREVKDTMRDSVYAQVVWAIDELGLTDLFLCPKSTMQILRKDTGQIIYFRGADDPGKIKSIKPPKDMHIGIIWAEEADQIPGGAAWRNILQSAFRGGDEGLIFRSYNTPISQRHHINKDALIDNPKRMMHHGHFRDMPPEWLGQAFFDLADQLKESNPRAYAHEYDGEATGTGESVFENVTVRKITSEELDHFDRLYYGLDWGYFPDPLHFAEMHYDAARQTLYIFGEKRRWKSTNEATARALTRYQNVRITADSAESKSVADFKAWGFNMSGAEKGPGSVDYSIKWLQSLREIIIDTGCDYTCSEFTSYEYEKNKDGEVLSGYPDKDNHAIDAVRYALESVWKKKGQ
ncbi:MAG: phage terminase large subunit [Oscillospiraceae bacterium]|nr:phage terminase large subunit [Oscillospiraceae bacterium]